MRAGDRDRERATAALQEHYVGGRLTLEELSTAPDVFAARSRAEIRRALGLARPPGFRRARGSWDGR